MQTQDVRVTIRVDRKLKENAETLFEYLGLNMSNAVNIFLRKAVDERGIPFPVNTGSQGIGGLNSDEVTKVFNDAVKQDIAKKQKNGSPIARYDPNQPTKARFARDFLLLWVFSWLSVRELCAFQRSRYLFPRLFRYWLSGPARKG